VAAHEEGRNVCFCAIAIAAASTISLRVHHESQAFDDLQMYVSASLEIE